ncbi:MAG: hypothetical protein GF411_05230 [Candidatus Lokiarchaeota archaeon]|nr:hypothetical protein [Candidatus Lokiarchaeota archaeon]
MRFIKGLRLLLTKTWYSFSFILSLVATAIISLWIIMFGGLDPIITDPFQGLAISIVVSFQYFIILLIIFSLVAKGQHLFFNGPNAFRNQVLLSFVVIALFMVLGPITAILGPPVGVSLSFGDALITGYFTVLLGWNIGKSIRNKIESRPSINWVVFFFFLIIGIISFGGAYTLLGLESLPFEQQMILLMFPLGMILLPVVTILFRDKTKGPEQSSFMVLVLFCIGLFYTFRLVNISNPQWTLFDILVQSILLFYGLSSTVAKVHENESLRPLTAITVVLLVILSRVGSQVNRLLAAATGWGDIVQVGITSFTIVNLSVLGLLVPAYWMWKRKASNE